MRRFIPWMLFLAIAPAPVARAPRPAAPQPGPVEDSIPAYEARTSPDQFILKSPDRLEDLAFGAASVEGMDLPGPAWESVTDGVSSRRGPLTELYRFEPERVEQIFVLDTRPATDAVTVRVPVTLPDHVDPRPMTHGPWRNNGIVFQGRFGRILASYYGAFAVDATGARLDLHPHWHHGHIVLSVPPAFVTSAVFPLTIDPWIQFGTSATGAGIGTNGGTGRVDLAITSAGHPVVAYEDWNDVGSNKIFVKRWNGSSWTDYGGSGSGDGIVGPAPAGAFSPAIALTSDDRPMVTWTMSDGSDMQAYYREWTGAAWVELGGSGSGSGISAPTSGANDPVIAADSADLPCIAYWNAVTITSDVFFVRWNGASWTGLGGSGSGTGISSPFVTDWAPSLAVDSNDAPHVAWEHYPPSTNTTEIHYRYWNGAAWTELAGSGSGTGISNTGGYSFGPSLAVDSAHQPVVAWYFSGIGAIYLRRWNGASWIELGGSASGVGLSGGEGDNSSPSLALDSNDNPCVAWDYYKGGAYDIRMRQWNGSAWVDVSGSGTGGGISGHGSVYDCSLGLTSSDVPVVAYRTETGNPYVRTYSPTTFSGALVQQTLAGTPLVTGAATSENAVRFAGTPSGDTFQFRLQIEVQPVGVAFTGNPTHESPFGPVGAPASIAALLGNGSYHWQARTLTDAGSPSDWQSFGGNLETEADVVVSFTGGGVVNYVTTKKSRCGLLGFEPIALIGLLALGRRKRQDRS